MSLIPPLSRQRHVDLCETEASQGYSEKPVLEKKEDIFGVCGIAYIYACMCVPPVCDVDSQRGQKRASDHMELSSVSAGKQSQVLCKNSMYVLLIFEMSLKYLKDILFSVVLGL